MRKRITFAFLLMFACLGLWANSFPQSGYTAGQSASIMKALCPDLAKKIGDDKLMAVINAKLTATQGGTATYDFDPSILTDLDKFFSQVLPLYSYQRSNRIAPEKDLDRTYTANQIYQAPKDGCYYGVGDMRNTYDPWGINCEQCREKGGKVKTNGSYAWGMSMAGDKLYWSTNNNYLCMPGYGRLVDLSASDSLVTSCWVCEYKHGTRGAEVGVYGDIVPPRIYEYDTKSGTVKDITPEEPLLKQCQGLRSACYHNGIMFFGGPSIKGGSATTSGSSCFLAYDAEKGEFIGSSDLATVEGCQITNVRRWIVVDGVLYCGVGLITPQGVAKGGILRWTGNKKNPFLFKIVGYVPGDAAELVYHNGYIYAGAWPSATATTGLYRSNPLSSYGLTERDAYDWQCVWDYGRYEPEASIAKATYISVLKSYKGKLIWGMFGNTYGVLSRTMAKFNTIQSSEAMAYMLGSLRATTLWSTTNFVNDNDLQLLYGEEELPKYDESTKTWSLVSNGFGRKPLYGRSGFGNIFTCYTWAMAELNNRLYIGTMDMSDLIEPGLAPSLGGGDSSDNTTLNTFMNIMGVDKSKYGYELLVMDSPNEAAKTICDNGFGNPSAYGIRNMVTYGNHLFIGTANPLNLSETGGWEIIDLTATGTTTGIKSTEVKPAEIIYKKSGDYLVISSLKDELISQVKVTDINGTTVFTDEPKDHMAFVNVNDFPKGIYIITVVTPSVNSTIKFVNK